MAQTRSSTALNRFVATAGLLVGACVTAGFTWSTLAMSRGADTTAGVVEVEHGGSKTFVTVSFTTPDGQSCESFLYWPGPASVRAGDRVQIRYPDGDPCINVQPASEGTSWDSVVWAALVTTGAALGTYAAWRRPYIPPPRYADMP